MIFGSNIAKAHSEHNIRTPVIPPDILNKPIITLADSFLIVPVSTPTDMNTTHQVQQYGQNMGNAEVEKNDFHQLPVPLKINA